MKTIEILMNEHQIICQKLNQFGKINIENIESKLNTIEGFINFFHLYADKYHHAKEEEILFKWMLEQSPGLEFGPIAVMLSDHNHGRELINNIKNALDAANKGNKDSQQFIVQNISDFVAHLSTHIMKEDTVLYMIANQLNDQVGNGDELMMPKFETTNQANISIAKEFGIIP